MAALVAALTMAAVLLRWAWRRSCTATGRRGAEARSSSGPALAARDSYEPRPRRGSALCVGAAVVAITALALATLAGFGPMSADLRGRDARSQGQPAVSLPIRSIASASAQIRASESAARHGGALLTRGRAIEARFTASRVALRVVPGTLGLSLAAVGRSHRLERVAPVAPSRAASEILYRHRSISESYRNGPSGLEQALTLRRRQAGRAALVLALRISGSLTPEQAGSQVLFKSRAGAAALRYRKLSAQDATGRQLSADVRVRDRTVQLLIDDRSSRYPLRIGLAVSPAGAGSATTGQSVMAWGANSDGQLGSGSTEASDVPVPVSGLTGVSSVSAGRDHSLATGSRPPTVIGVSPNSGGEVGGTPVTISGIDLTGAMAVHFGRAHASSFTVDSATSITAVSPAGTGVVDVTVTTPGGATPTSAADQFI